MVYIREHDLCEVPCLQSLTGYSCGNALFCPGLADGRALPACVPFPVCPVLLLRAAVPQTCKFDNLVSSPTWTSLSVPGSPGHFRRCFKGSFSCPAPLAPLHVPSLAPCCHMAVARVLCSPAGTPLLATTKPEL